MTWPLRRSCMYVLHARPLLTGEGPAIQEHVRRFRKCAAGGGAARSQAEGRAGLGHTSGRPGKGDTAAGSAVTAADAAIAAVSTAASSRDLPAATTRLTTSAAANEPATSSPAAPGPPSSARPASAAGAPPRPASASRPGRHVRSLPDLGCNSSVRAVWPPVLLRGMQRTGDGKAPLLPVLLRAVHRVHRWGGLATEYEAIQWGFVQTT